MWMAMKIDGLIKIIESATPGQYYRRNAIIFKVFLLDQKKTIVSCNSTINL